MMRTFVFKLLYPFFKFLGRTRLPFSRKKLKADDYRNCAVLAKEGDVLLGKRHGELTNLAIPGYWPHVAMYVGNDSVIEAIGEGVVRTDLIDFVLSRDEVAIYRPIATSEVTRGAVAFVRDQIGKEYDYLFDSSNEAFYCAELVCDAYSSDLPINKKNVMGQITFIPDSIANNEDAWKLVWKK